MCMKEIISSILSAEAKAEEIVKTAQEQAKQIILDADRSSDEIMETTVSEFKTYRKSEIIKAENLAENKYNEILFLGEKKAEKVSVEARNKVDSVADYVLKEILG